MAKVLQERQETPVDAGPGQQSVTDSLNEAPLSRFHLRAALTAGMGFFTDAYDLFIIGVAMALIKVEWHASPGYITAFITVDAIGFRKLQVFGFLAMGSAFLLIGGLPNITHMLVPFLGLYGLSYFITQFGPNTTTFLMAAELYPVSARTTGHGLSAGMAKVGAFVGVLTFPLIQAAVGIPGVMLVAFGASVIGALLTFVLPEPSGQTLEAISGEDDPPWPRRLMVGAAA